MEEIIKSLGTYGIELVIIALFLYDWWKNKDKITETLGQNSKILDELRNSNTNTSKSLELLQKTIDTQKEFLFEHDKRCEHIQNSISEINIKMG